MPPPRSARITLVRHGQSVANHAKRWQGQSDSPLSELGVRQARALAARLKKRGFDRIVASDLSRASDTAAAIGRPFERWQAFREFDVGAWENCTREEIAARFPDQLARLDAGEDVALGGGETYAAFSARIDEALAALAETLAPGAHALVVCHGGVIGALVAGVLGLRESRALPIGRVFNTSITELSFDDAGRASLRVFNDALHLAALSLFPPHPSEATGAVALVCDAAPAPAFGAFAAHFDYAREPGLGDDAGLGAIVGALLARHPGARVSLQAPAAQVHDWVRGTLFGDRPAAAEVVPPVRGAVSHVHARDDGTVALLDYGVMAESV